MTCSHQMKCLLLLKHSMSIMYSHENAEALSLKRPKPYPVKTYQYELTFITLYRGQPVTHVQRTIGRHDFVEKLH